MNKYSKASAEAVIQNYSKAFELFSKAASQGLIDAQRALGVMYHLGLGMEVEVRFRRICGSKLPPHVILIIV